MSMQQKTLKALHLDERGAMMLMSVFMATIAVAMLYYVAAVGESIAYRERLQDGADATTFVGAAVMARSMNVVVVMNLAIAAIFASAVIANAVFYIMIAAQLAADAACAASWGTCVNCCIAAVCLIGDICEARGDRSDVEDEVEDGVEAANDIQNFLRSNARIAAVAASVEVAGGFGDPVPGGLGGIAIGSNLPFELRTDRGRMCDHTIGPNLIDEQRATITALALIQAVEIACNQGKAYTVAGLVTGAGLGLICNQSHGRVDPEQAQMTANLGQREFQFFGGVAGNDPPIDANDQRVGVATWGGSSTASDGLGLRDLARVAIAQSEYYHGSREGQRDQTWSAQWRARLRRFNFTQAGGGLCGGAFSGVCGALGSAIVH